MILYATSAVLFLVVSFSLFFRADCPLAVKIGGSALILLVSLKYVIYQVLGGYFFAPQLQRAFLMCMEALYGALIVLFFLLLLWDVYLLGNWLLARLGVPVPGRLPTGLIKSCLVGFSLAVGLWGMWQAVRVPSVREMTITVPNLPEPLQGLVIVQLSDLHIGPILKKDWLSEVVELANSQKPDIVALTGDYVDGHVSELAGELAPLAGLKARYGVFGVNGNHEYYWNMQAWQKVLRSLGVRMLNNEFQTLDIDGQPFVIAGLTDLAANRFGLPGPDVEAALANAPEAVRLLLAHQPSPAPEYSRLADIHLAGHTHGGLMFFLQPLVARFNNGFVSGGYRVNDMKLYVSPGTGLWNGFSFRLGVPSEITRIVLQAAEA